MNKNTINYLLLAIGIGLLIWGLYSFGYSNQNPITNKGAVFAVISGIILISKRLSKTKDLPSKEFKERLRNKD